MREEPTVWLSQLLGGFAFALLDAHLVNGEPNGSLASAIESKAISIVVSSVQRELLVGGAETGNIIEINAVFTWQGDLVYFRRKKC